ncbi:glycosyltransferase [Paenibacillus chitinolyticus]|uniref:glycosyltransferase n=1 Tax=Paenibacillus chitinolyticus TaxID=79263 RepID=UPI0036532B5E
MYTGNKTISLCMIVKDEERSLDRCLSSVQGIVNEIIIVDTGSIDRTKEIASKYTDKIYDFEWVNDFSKARNYALSFAKSDYILQLDADEMLENTADFKEVLLDKDFYYIQIKNDLGGGMSVSHQFIRLFKNTPSTKYTGSLHEQVQFDHSQASYDFLPCWIRHDGYQNEVIKSKKKSERNLKIIQKEISYNPNAYTYHNLGMQYINDGRFNEALEALKKSYSMGKNYSFSQKVLLEIMRCLHEMEQFREVISVGRGAVELYPDVTDLWYQLGLSFLEMQQVKDAEFCFKQCLEIGEETGNRLFYHYEGTGSFMAHGKLAEIYVLEGNKILALEHLYRAANLAPNVLALVKILLTIYPNSSSKDLFQMMMNTWPVDTNRYLSMIGLLYAERNPLLKEFVDTFNLKLQYPMSVLYEIFSNNYDQALEQIEKIENVVEQSAHDLVLLSFLLNKPDILLKHKNSLPSLSHKELKWLIQTLNVTEPLPKEVFLGPTLTSLLEQLVKDLIRLQHYEHIDLLINRCAVPALRLLISKNLQVFGFDELALNVLVESSQANENYLISLAAAGLLFKLKQYDDALYYYIQAEKTKKQFALYYDMWKIYKIKNQDGQAQQILEKMNELYPESYWVEQQISSALKEQQL